MIIAISGLHGTGKSTVAKLLAEKYSLTYYSTGTMFRELAKERGLTLEEFSKIAEVEKKIDLEIDNKIKNYVEKGNCIVDNQLSPYLLGNLIDFCVLLKCTKDVRLGRMLKRDGDTMEQKIKETLIREESEQKRFLEYYNVDILNGNVILGLYNLIIDTTNIDQKGVARIISKAVDEFIRCKNIEIEKLK
jgi:cytidylate kinase